MNLRRFYVRRLAPRLARKGRVFEEHILCGRTLRARPGSVSMVPDYDDAWNLALGRHSRTVFDIGANQGYTALLFLSVAEVESVVLVDPNAHALSIAADNLIENHLCQRARFVCAFAGEQAGDEIDFWMAGPGAASSRYPGHAQTAARTGTSIAVPTTTLDELWMAMGASPDLVKIDVEGAENEVLRGGRTLAAKVGPLFLVELHSPPELPMVENVAAILTWCKEQNYRAWYLSRGVEVVAPEQMADRGRCHVLLHPEDEPVPEYMLSLSQGCDLEHAML